MYVARVRLQRNAFKLLVRKSEGKRPLGIHKREKGDNIETDLRIMECYGLELSQGGGQR